MFVIQRCHIGGEGDKKFFGKYLQKQPNPTGLSYGPLETARVFSTEDNAQKDCCVLSERVVSINEIFRG